MKRVFLGTRRARIVTCLALVGMALLVVGATQLTQEMRDRPRRCLELTRCWREWSRTLLTAVPGAERSEWQNLTDECPLLILQACSRPVAKN